MIRQIDFSKYSSIKIGSTFDVLMIKEIDNYDEYKIVGEANNLLISPKPKKLAILSKEFDYIKLKNNLLYVGASVSSGKLLSFCKKNNIANFEFLLKLPGSIGGIVKMNAGVKSYEIFNNLIAIKTKNGYINKEDVIYDYRFTNINDIIYEVIFKVEYGFSNELLKTLLNFRLNQPKEPSAGSCFKNPKNDFAGRLLEEVKLKGYKIGEACFSQVHANFLINLGSATFEDAQELINLAKKRVYENFKIELQEEIIVL